MKCLNICSSSNRLRASCHGVCVLHQSISVLAKVYVAKWAGQSRRSSPLFKGLKWSKRSYGHRNNAEVKNSHSLVNCVLAFCLRLNSLKERPLKLDLLLNLSTSRLGFPSSSFTQNNRPEQTPHTFSTLSLLISCLSCSSWQSGTTKRY